MMTSIVFEALYRLRTALQLVTILSSHPTSGIEIVKYKFKIYLTKIYISSEHFDKVNDDNISIFSNLPALLINNSSTNRKGPKE